VPDRRRGTPTGGRLGDRDHRRRCTGNDSSPTFEFTLGGKPEINGPVFLSDPARSTFSQPTTIVEGDVWYPNSDCAETVTTTAESSTRGRR
jgi:hypothetical protein